MFKLLDAPSKLVDVAPQSGEYLPAI